MTPAERSYELAMFADEERASITRADAVAAAARLDALEARQAAAGYDLFGGPLPEAAA